MQPDFPTPPDAASSDAAEVIVPSPDLTAGMDFFLDHGFRINQIFPADDPETVRLTGHGLALRLERDASGPPPTLRLITGGPVGSEVTGPNGTLLHLVPRGADQLVLPDLVPSFTLNRISDADAWHTGRAGMHYRDLIPDRLGGRFVASHIRIVEGGPVPDYVHHHDIRFQMIYCHQGWVDVVYEDQGPAFRLEAGDCVLQPPGIRHRVLESSAGCEVVEIGCPAIHATTADHELTLPTTDLRPDRDFGGQRFVRHHRADAPDTRAPDDYWSVRNTGIDTATDGLASVRVLSAPEGPNLAAGPSDHEFHFTFVLEGGASLTVADGDPMSLETGDAFCIPGGDSWTLSNVQPESQLLEIVLPAQV